MANKHKKTELIIQVLRDEVKNIQNPNDKKEINNYINLFEKEMKKMAKIVKNG